MKSNLKIETFIKVFYGIFTTLPLILTIYFYPSIPNNIPIHYWIDGTIDKWGNKSELLILPIFIIIFVLCQTKIFKLNFNYKTEDNITRWHNIYFLLILNVLVTISLYISLNFETCLSRFNFYNFFSCTICFIFAFMGNYIQNCKRDSSFSIRNKFTLENEIIWIKTHKFCGILWFTGSIVFFPMFLFSYGLCLGIITLVMLFIFAIFPILYTHHMHKKFIEGKLTNISNDNIIQHSS